jgi:hypothetical protein
MTKAEAVDSLKRIKKVLADSPDASQIVGRPIGESYLAINEMLHRGK